MSAADAIARSRPSTSHAALGGDVPSALGVSSQQQESPRPGSGGPRGRPGGPILRSLDGPGAHHPQPAEGKECDSQSGTENLQDQNQPVSPTTSLSLLPSPVFNASREASNL